MPFKWGASNRSLREEPDKTIEDCSDSGACLGDEIGLITRLALKHDREYGLHGDELYCVCARRRQCKRLGRFLKNVSVLAVRF